jgi:hypothetical protein
MQHGDLDRAEGSQRSIGLPRDADRLLDGGVEELHVPDHQPLTVAIRPLDGRQAVGLGEGHGERLLGQDRQPAGEGRLGDVPVRPGRQDDEPVELDAVEHGAHVSVPVCRRNPISLADRGQQPRRQVAQRGDREGLGEAREEGQVDRLSDGSEARDADTQRAARHPKGRGMGHRVGV